jgi:hypothetical protein
MSAFGGKADMAFCTANVCFWHLADIEVMPSNVRFRGQSGHCTRAKRLLGRQTADITDLLVTHNKVSLLFLN